VCKLVLSKRLETLEKFLEHDPLNENVRTWINNDIDYIYVNYLRYEPDGEAQANIWENVQMSDVDAIHLLSTRICNTLQTI